MHCNWTIYQELCQLMIRTVQAIFYHIFVETKDCKACMSPTVCDTENMEITNPKTWPRPRDFCTET